MIKVLIKAGEKIEYKDSGSYHHNIVTNHGVLEIHKCSIYSDKVIAAYPKGLWVGAVNE